MNDLYKWCSSNDFFTRTKENHTPSHLIYDGYKGGKLYIPKNKEYEFLKMYSIEAIKGTKLYFVETRPKVFKFMIDVDITDEYYWPEENILNLSVKIQEVICEFFESPGPTICCISPEKVKKDKIHTGIHLIWPGLVVCSETALIIRRGLIQKLKESDIIISKPWEDIFDEVIYTRNGYRMTYSDKMYKDKETGEKIIENRKLDLLFVVDKDGVNEIYTQRLKNDIKTLCSETSIRYVIETPPMSIKIPEWLDEDAIHIKEGRSSAPGKIASSTEHLHIEKFMRKTLPKPFARGIIKEVCRYHDGNILIKTSSRYCMNLGRAHNSCGIYFFGSPLGMYQKCLCPCNTLEGRKDGYCKDFTSECFKWPEDLRTLLFPEFNYLANTKKKKNSYEPFNPNREYIEKQLVCDKMLEDIMKF